MLFTRHHTMRHVVLITDIFKEDSIELIHPPSRVAIMTLPPNCNTFYISEDMKIISA